MRWEFLLVALTLVASARSIQPFFPADLIMAGQSHSFSGTAEQIKYLFFDVMPENGGSQFPHEAVLSIKSKNSKTTVCAVVQRGSWASGMVCPSNYETGLFASPYQCNATSGFVEGTATLSVFWPATDRYYVTIAASASDTITVSLSISYCAAGVIGHNCTWPLTFINDVQAGPINITVSPNQFQVYSFEVPSSGGGPASMKIDMATYEIDCDPNDNSSLWFRFGSVGYHSQMQGRLEVSVALNCTYFESFSIMYPETGIWFLTVYGGMSGITGAIGVDFSCGLNTTGMHCESDTEVPMCTDPVEPEECGLFDLVPVMSSGQNWTNVPFIDVDGGDQDGFSPQYWYVDIKNNAYDLKVTISAAPGSQNFTLIARSGNVPSIFPNAEPALKLEDAYQYYAMPNASYVAEMRIHYASAGYVWYFVVWSDPAAPVVGATFNITFEWHHCYADCNNRGSCDKLSSTCHCNSGWKGVACDDKQKSGAGLALGLIFGLFLPLLVIAGGGLYYHFYIRNRQQYEMIGRE